jgi:hypothetical protein
MRGVLLLIALSSWRSPNFPEPGQLTMRFASGEFGRNHSARTQHVDLPFQLKSEGINGTARLLGFLQSVEPTGAKYISEVSYSLQLVYRGTAVECTSKILVADSTQPRPALPPLEPPPAEGEYTTSVAPWRPDLADDWVVDRELHCKQAAVSRVITKATHDDDYSPEVKRNPDSEAWSFRQAEDRVEPQVVKDAVVSFYEDCNLIPTKRFVHRYRHFLAARFAPPDLDRVGKRYSDVPLVELPPECHRIERVAGAPLRQHITADLHYVADVAPKEMPRLQIRGFAAGARETD